MRVRMIAIVAVVVLMAPGVECRADSLWRGATIAESSYFSAQPVQPRQVNDIVFILVSESTTANAGTNMDVESESKIKGEVKSWFGFSGWKNLLDVFKGDSVDLKTKQNDSSNLPQWEFNVKNEYEGDGKTSRTDSVDTKIAAKIIEINPNGNMVLEARRHMRINREDCQLMVTGVARPEDIDADNQIESSKIVDLNIQVIGKGDVTSRTKPGLISTMIGFIR